MNVNCTITVSKSVFVLELSDKLGRRLGLKRTRGTGNEVVGARLSLFPRSFFFFLAGGGGGGFYSKLLSRLLVDHKIEITIIRNDCVMLKSQNRDCLFLLDCLCLPDNF